MKSIKRKSTPPDRNNKRLAWIAAGLCRDCGKRPLIENRNVCEQCFKNRKTRGNNRAKRNKLNGICRQCCKPSRPNKILCLSCHEKVIENFRFRRKSNKEFIINHFGGKCVECNETDIRCLGLDHIDGDGYIDKKTENGAKQLTPTWYAKLIILIKNNQPLPRRLQLLCHNCHAKKDLIPWWFK